MKVITAPEDYTRRDGDVFCFLAGGIQNCPNWQKKVIEQLQSMEIGGVDLSHLVVFNPRRDNFPVHDPNAAEEQIAWEFKWLEQTDIFSMFFSNGTSDQPICMYELGRNVVRLMKSGNWIDRIIVSVEDGYRRKQDVNIQMKLATGTEEVVINSANPMVHAARILSKYTKLVRG